MKFGRLAQLTSKMAAIGSLLIITACAQTTMTKSANRAELMVEAYDSEVAAVVAAANAFNPVSILEDREFMGAVYQCEHGYQYSVGAGEAGAGNVTVKIATPAGCELTALWHTHGAENHKHQYFSEIDTRLVEQTQLPFYMADYTGSLKVFAPGDNLISPFAARKMGLGNNHGYARGTLVADASGTHVEVATRIQWALAE
jgi:hypothetical protein